MENATLAHVALWNDAASGGCGSQDPREARPVSGGCGSQDPQDLRPVSGGCGSQDPE